jgi:hypothetical protein
VLFSPEGGRYYRKAVSHPPYFVVFMSLLMLRPAASLQENMKTRDEKEAHRLPQRLTEE